MKRDLLAINDLSQKEIFDLLDKSADLKEKRQKGIEHTPLKGKTLGMIFNKNSTRTRISFEVGTIVTEQQSCNANYLGVGPKI